MATLTMLAMTKIVVSTAIAISATVPESCSSGCIDGVSELV